MQFNCSSASSPLNVLGPCPLAGGTITNSRAGKKPRAEVTAPFLAISQMQAFILSLLWNEIVGTANVNSTHSDKKRIQRFPRCGDADNQLSTTSYCPLAIGEKSQRTRSSRCDSPTAEQAYRPPLARLPERH